jgi:hypothetical protein
VRDPNPAFEITRSSVFNGRLFCSKLVIMLRAAVLQMENIPWDTPAALARLHDFVPPGATVYLEYYVPQPTVDKLEE